MREHMPWTITLGRWGDVHVRLHMFFLLVAASVLYLSWLAGQSGEGGGTLWLAVLGMLVLLASVALHAAGHVFAAAKFGLDTNPLVIGPLGDFVHVVQIHDPREHLIVALAGPAVNLLLVLACIPAVLALTDTPLLSLLNPILQLDLRAGNTWIVALELTLWINCTLLLVNLLPARPFDGSQIACALVVVFRPRINPRHLTRLASRLGLITGLVLIAAAWLTWNTSTSQLMPPWFALALLAIVVLFSAQRRPDHPTGPRTSNDEVFGYDFSEGYTSLERSHSHLDGDDEFEDEDTGPLERWLDTRRQSRSQRQQQMEAAEDERVDEILARVHEDGIESLTDEERLLLQRVSQRYRTRGSS